MRGRILALLAVLLTGAPALAAEEGLPGDSRSAQRLAPEQRQMLATVARNAATAAQLGSIASPRMGASRLGELSQSMAVTNGGLAQQLVELAGPENLPMRERLDQSEIARLRALASNDPAGLSRQLVGWITSHYPDTIRNVETLGSQDPRYAALAQATLPQLREQLAAAQQIAQSAMEGEAQLPH
ncbi:MAG TPA: DUF4142 domain-containing protein [Magnetospirillum sp.]|jgi:hypothetical protein|nr:DUF4142 domain-containing protein [Magnetospirillum sp.]